MEDKKIYSKIHKCLQHWFKILEMNFKVRNDACSILIVCIVIYIYSYKTQEKSSEPCMAWPDTALATIPADCAFEIHQNIVNIATIDKHPTTPLSKPFWSRY